MVEYAEINWDWDDDWDCDTTVISVLCWIAHLIESAGKKIIALLLGLILPWMQFLDKLYFGL